MHGTVTHLDEMAFEVDLDGHRFPIDARPEHGGEGRGPSPKSLLLAALGGCTAMDVRAILRKMRQPVRSLRVRLEADLTEEHPKMLRDIQVHFEVAGEVDPKRLWRAVALSRDRYCGVQAMLARSAEITVRVELNGEVLPEP